MLDGVAGAGLDDHRTQVRDAAGVQSRIAEEAADQPGLGGRCPLERAGDQHGALALAQVVAGRLPGLLPGRRRRRAGRRATGTPRRAAARRRSRPASSDGAGAGQRARRACSGRLDRVLRALVPDRPAGPARPSRPGRPAPARAGPGTARPSARCASRSKTRPARGPARRRSSPLPVSSSSHQTRHRSPSRIAAPAGRTRPGSPAPARAAVQRRRSAGARPASRGGCRSRPSRRRGSSARPGAAPARRRPRRPRSQSGPPGTAPAPVAERRPQPLAAAGRRRRPLDQRAQSGLTGPSRRPGRRGSRRAPCARGAAGLSASSGITVIQWHGLGSRQVGTASSSQSRGPARLVPVGGPAACPLPAGDRPTERHRRRDWPRRCATSSPRADARLLRVLPARRPTRASAQLWQAIRQLEPLRAVVRVGDVRRRRLHPGPHGPDHRADRHRDDADCRSPT